MPHVKRRATFLGEGAGPAAATLEALLSFHEQILRTQSSIAELGRRASRRAAAEWQTVTSQI
eukprot:1071732-Pyramimonas_sp.AAC.1